MNEWMNEFQFQRKNMLPNAKALLLYRSLHELTYLTFDV